MAAALTDKAHSVSVIGIESVPFKTALGEKVGKAIMKVETGEPSLPLLAGVPSAAGSVFLQLFEANRVKFYMMSEVSEMVGHHGQVLRKREIFRFGLAKANSNTSSSFPTAERGRAEQRQGPAGRRLRHRSR